MAHHEQERLQIISAVAIKQHTLSCDLRHVRPWGSAITHKDQSETRMTSAENDQKTLLISLASDIVAAHVSNNVVSLGEVPSLISSVYNALAGLGEEQVKEDTKPEPAVAIRNSIKPDYIVCLEDGAKLKMLKRYLRTNFDMSPEEYKARWSLPADYPMVAPNYAEKRRELAKKIGLGRKPAAGKAAST